MYERKIIYLHRYEGEVDKGNAGYMKQEVCNGIYTFTVMLMNLPPSYEAESYLIEYTTLIEEKETYKDVILDILSNPSFDF